jgi:hypothetical protein
VSRGVAALPFTLPIRSVPPRAWPLVAGSDIRRLSRALFEAAWANDRNIEDPSVLGELCAGLGLTERWSNAQAPLPPSRRCVITRSWLRVLGRAARRQSVVDGEVFGARSPSRSWSCPGA